MDTINNLPLNRPPSPRQPYPNSPPSHYRNDSEQPSGPIPPPVQPPVNAPHGQNTDGITLIRGLPNEFWRNDQVKRHLSTVISWITPDPSQLTQDRLKASLGTINTIVREAIRTESTPESIRELRCRYVSFLNIARLICAHNRFTLSETFPPLHEIPLFDFVDRTKIPLTEDIEKLTSEKNKERRWIKSATFGSVPYYFVNTNKGNAGSSKRFRDGYSQAGPIAIGKCKIPTIHKMIALFEETVVLPDQIRKRLGPEADTVMLDHDDLFLYMGTHKKQPILKLAIISEKARPFDVSSLDRHKQMGYYHQAFQILEKFHQAGIVHGDMKSENFVINPDDNSLRIIDFGMVSIASIGYSSWPTQLGGTSPTPEHFELSDAEKKALPTADRVKSDIWGLALSMVADQIERAFWDNGKSLEEARKISNYTLHCARKTPVQFLSDITRQDTLIGRLFNQTFPDSDPNMAMLKDLILNCLNQDYHQRYGAQEALNHSYFETMASDER